LTMIHDTVIRVGDTSQFIVMTERLKAVYDVYPKIIAIVPLDEILQIECLNGLYFITYEDRSRTRHWIKIVDNEGKELLETTKLGTYKKISSIRAYYITTMDTKTIIIFNNHKLMTIDNFYDYYTARLFNGQVNILLAAEWRTQHVNNIANKYMVNYRTTDKSKKIIIRLVRFKYILDESGQSLDNLFHIYDEVKAYDEYNAKFICKRNGIEIITDSLGFPLDEALEITKVRPVG